MLISRLLGEAELDVLLTFVSPTFFKVVPARGLARQVRTLAANRRDSVAYRQACEERRTTLARDLDALTIGASSETGGPPGERVVELFFHQLFADDLVLADLRPEAFGTNDGVTTWQPAPIFARWNADFLAALRCLYRGFYSGHDEDFRAALAELNLAASEDVFREHFGEGQSKVVFAMGDFVSTFHRVFVNCKRAGASLHADFIILGIYLATLYQNLERFADGVHVRRAFERATSASSDPSREELADVS